MPANKKHLIVIILVGGLAVLGSYVYGILSVPDAGDILWGGVSKNIRPFYTVGMLLGALGFFAYTYFIVFCLDPREVQICHRYEYGIFSILYIAILVPSALWLPLSYLAVQTQDSALILAVRFDLILVGIASICLLLTLWFIEPRQPVWAHSLALLGCIFFCIQTVILDAIVWGSYFQTLWK